MRARRFKFECGSNTSCKLLYSGSPGQINRQGLRMATQDAAAAQLLTGRSRLRECTTRLWEFGQRVLPVGRSGRTRAGGSSRRPQTPSVRPGELQRPKPRPAPTTQRAGPAWAERLSARGRRRPRPHTTRKPLENPRLRTGFRKHTLNAPRPRSRPTPRPGPGSAFSPPIPTVRPPARNI